MTSKILQHQQQQQQQGAAAAAAAKIINISPTFMISGHIDISWQTFLVNYAALIERAIHGYLPANFVPKMPNVQNFSVSPSSLLPPFDVINHKFAPFLVDVIHSDDNNSAAAQQQHQQHPIMLQNPDPTIQHTVTSTLNSIPLKTNGEDMIPPTASLFSSSSPSSVSVKTFLLSPSSLPPNENFQILYQPRFVVGDAPGTDFFAQVYLTGRGFANFLTVFHRGNQPRCIVSSSSTRNNNSSKLLLNPIKLMGNFRDHTDKDEAMSRASDVDIAWIRSSEEQKQIYGEKFRFRISGTEKNILRRKQWGDKNVEKKKNNDEDEVVVEAQCQNTNSNNNQQQQKQQIKKRNNKSRLQ